MTQLPPTLPPIRTRRELLISADESARIHELALSILADIGMQIHHDLARTPGGRGFRVNGERVFFDAPVVESYVDEMRRHIAARPRALEPADDGQLSLSISSYSLWVQDLKTGEVVPCTTDRLIEMTKLVDTPRMTGHTASRRASPSTCTRTCTRWRYRIAALDSRQGASPVDPIRSHGQPPVRHGRSDGQPHRRPAGLPAVAAAARRRIARCRARLSRPAGAHLGQQHAVHRRKRAAPPVRRAGARGRKS